jgi:hypothetical protein
MTAAALFARCGKALYGDGIRWKEQFGTALGIGTDSMDAMSKGDTRISPGVWRAQNLDHPRPPAYLTMRPETVCRDRHDETAVLVQRRVSCLG